MSRLRKGGKYKGGSFAKTFKVGLATRTPFSFVTDETPDPSGIEEENKSSGPVVAGENKEPTSNTTDASKENASEEDIIPSDTEYSREEVDSYFQRRKLAKERAELEALKKQQEEESNKEEEEAAEIEEEERESLSQGENIEGSYDDEFDPTMTGKERREESRENKGQIRDAKKEAKKAAKDEFKNKKADIKASGLKGKAKRDAKKDARKDKRDDKKSIRQNKKSAKKSNRKSKRKSRKNKRKNK
tara:strand:- start:3670 stop:4404 length:735 start_codon:yes stop_codon:yes gene_type:complete